MTRMQWAIALPAALATAALSMLFFASFGYGIRHAVMGRFEEFPLWLVGIYLGLLAIHGVLFGYGHVSVVRSLRRRDAA